MKGVVAPEAILWIISNLLKIENNIPPTIKMEWVEISNCTHCPENLKCLRPQFYRLPILCLHEGIKNLTEFLRKGPTETTTTTASAIILPITPSPPAAFPFLFWAIIICLLVTILLLQIVTMAKAVRDRLAKRASSKGHSHHRRQRPHQGPGHGVERNTVGRPPFVQAFPAPLEVNSRPAAVGSFHQQLNRQWALAEHAAQPVQNEVVSDRVVQQLEDIPEEEDEEF